MHIHVFISKKAANYERALVNHPPAADHCIPTCNDLQPYPVFHSTDTDIAVLIQLNDSITQIQ